jgi:hypothetical protein
MVQPLMTGYCQGNRHCQSCSGPANFGIFTALLERDDGLANISKLACLQDFLTGDRIWVELA